MTVEGRIERGEKEEKGSEDNVNQTVIVGSLRLSVNMSLHADLWPSLGEGGVLEMLAFTQVNSVTDMKRAGMDKEHDKSGGEVIQLALFLLLLFKQLRI